MSDGRVFDPPSRILMGPGPSGAHPRVLRAMAAPILGHLDPAYLRLMDATRSMLRAVMRTANAVTLATPGTGTSGMEAALVNLIEPGDNVVVGICGYFGERLADIAARAGGRVTRVAAPWGEPLDADAMAEAIATAGDVKVVAFVHAETSTGVLQPVEAIARQAKAAGALVLLDCVTSLGGVPVELDAWGVDAAYSATQKCLSSAPGLAPLTFSTRAWDAITSRRSPCPSFYLDATLLQAYWGETRAYHHTAPASLFYALHEALAVILDEGLEARWARHARNAKALQQGLEAMGLRLFARAEHRLPVLTTVVAPAGIDEAVTRAALLAEHAIEIGGGMGDLKGKAWRIGLMGEASSPRNVLVLLSALGHRLRAQGATVDVSMGLSAASEVLANTA